MIRTVIVGNDFPMKVGDMMRIRGGGELFEYLISKPLDEKGKKWEATVTKRETGTNKEPIMNQLGVHKIQRLRSNHFPTPEEVYKRSERDEN